MGQQQLLLLVLGIVIVGLAVVVGIQAFGENQKKANQDAMVNDGIRIASDAQAWALKPTAFGGGEGDFQDADGQVTFAKLGYEETSGDYVNVNGSFDLTGSTATALLITGTSANDADQQIFVSVCGLDSGDINTQVNPATAPQAPVCGG